jgi:hypothetical protein
MPILQAYGFSIHLICTILGVKCSSVFKTLQCYCKYGVPYNPHTKQAGQPCLLTGLLLAAYKDIQKQHPTDHLDELQAKFFNQHGLCTSASTLSHTHHQLHLTQKKVTIRACESNPLLQAV